MPRILHKSIATAAYYITLTLLAAFGLAFAQEPQDSSAPAQAPPPEQSAPRPGWRRFADASSKRLAYPSNQNGPSDPNRAQSQEPDPNQAAAESADQANSTIPSRLTIKPGTFVTVRVNQMLSSDRSRAGDGFSATLSQPLVVDGVVVAQREQTVAGRVAEARKAGRISGVSRLGIELTDLTLVDGQQVPIRSELIRWNGPRSVGRDAGAIAGTTALGAAVGAAADGGVGAGIGAGAGAAAGILGVLVTRGRPTVIYPESLVTFRIGAPVTISTDRAPQAFRYVEPTDYDRPYDSQAAPLRRRDSGCAGYGCPPPPPPYYYYGYYWPPYYPYFYGPSVGFFFGSRFHYGRGYFRGFRR
jgi:hypothetical protein